MVAKLQIDARYDLDYAPQDILEAVVIALDAGETKGEVLLSGGSALWEVLRSE